MMPRATLSLVSWLCLICTVAAQTLTFPALTGRVVDDASVFDAAGLAALTESLTALETKTSNQLVVVTLKSLQGTSIDDYGYQLGRQWQLGRKDKNNGILLIVAPIELKVRIEVGYGLEGILTDALTKVIIENTILPRFRAADFVGGVRGGVDEIARVLSGNATDLQRQATLGLQGNPTQPADPVSVWLVIVLVLLGIGLLVYCAVMGGTLCLTLQQVLLLLLLSGGHGSSRRGSSYSGGGGSFGGGGSSGSW